jgi:Tfp pilus assembly protein PilO
VSKDLRNTLLAAAFFLLVAVGLGYWVYGKKTDLDDLKAQNAQLQSEIDKLQQEASQKVIEGLQKQLSELNVNFKEYVQILPSEDVATIGNLNKLLQKYMTDSQITYESYSMRLSPGTADFQEIGIAIRGSGTFEQFVNFLNMLERHTTFLRVNTFNCAVDAGKIKVVSTNQGQFGGKDEIPLTISVDVSTFRYVPKKK